MNVNDLLIKYNKIWDNTYFIIQSHFKVQFDSVNGLWDSLNYPFTKIPSTINSQQLRAVYVGIEDKVIWNLSDTVINSFS